MRNEVASLFLAVALALTAGCAADDHRVEHDVHVRLYTEGVGDYGCVATTLSRPDQVVELTCDADGLTMIGTILVDPDQTEVAIVDSDAVDVLDRYIEVPAGYTGTSLWASVRIQERF